jgi:hypothetical protein
MIFAFYYRSNVIIPLVICRLRYLARGSNDHISIGGGETFECEGRRKFRC